MTNGLQTKRLLLRDATAEDAQLLCHWKSQFLLREMSVGLKTKISEANQRAEVLSSKRSGNLYLIMETKETATPIGYIKLRWLNHEQKRCWLSYGLGSHYHEGYTYEALHRLLSALFAHGLVCHVDAEVFEFNIASRKLLEKLQFRLAGQRRNEYFYQGRHWDIFMYVMTPKEAKHLLLEEKALEEEQISQSQ